jgi:uncharacterized protein (DUF2336 family)
MSSLAELDQAIAACDPSRRELTLGRLTDAFLVVAPSLGEPQVTLFDHVMLGLLRASGESARAALAIAIAPVPNAPVETSRSLALDLAARVAAPLLTLSTRVDLATLAEVAATRGPRHLEALATRIHMDPVWAEPLARRANARVLRILAENPAARDVPELAGALQQAKPAPPPPPDPQAREQERKRLEKELMRQIASGEWEGVVAVLATLADLRPQPLLAALSSRQLDPLLVCMKAANLGWDLAEPVVASRFGPEANANLIAEAASTYAHLSRESASRAMRVLLMKARMEQDRAA